MADGATVVNEGVNWARWPDGTVLKWDPSVQEWVTWNPGASGPQPPKAWVKEVGKAIEAKRAQAKAELRAQKEKDKAEQEKQRAVQRAEEQFRASPPGLARAAKAAGELIFQVVLPVSSTNKALFGHQSMIGECMATKTRQHSQSNVMAAIEAEGWRLEHAGYVFQPKGSQSRDRLLSSGQVETMVGEILGVYIFRAT